MIPHYSKHMLTKAQEKLIRSLKTKKGREESRRCLIEGQKLIATAGSLVEYTFTPKDTKSFSKLVTTKTPQEIAAVAQLPSFAFADVSELKTIVVLDGVQDPGNVGSALRLCQAFSAALILIESADPTSPKVIRSSAGAVFSVPWIESARSEAEELLTRINRQTYRLEKTTGAVSVKSLKSSEPIVLIAGSEGSGIHINTPGTSVQIEHNASLESLNVGNALAIALYVRAGSK